MSQVPMYIINLDESVPLPGGTFVLDVQADKLHLFSSVELNGIEYVVIGLANHPEPTEILEDPTAIIDPLLAIGILCEIAEKEPTDTFTVFTLNCLQRVLIRNLERNKTEEDPYTLWVEKELIIEEFLPGEKLLKAHIQDTLELFLNNKNVRDDISPSISAQLHSETHLLLKMHLLAEQLLQDQDRLQYLQQIDNETRWNILSTAISKRLNAAAKKLPWSVEKKVKQPAKKKPVKLLTWREQVEQSDMPEDVRKSIMREVSKLESTPKNNLERSQTADYLRWVLSIPWGKTSYVPTDLRKLHSILSATHYGLAEVKEHMLEIMCCQELAGGSNGSVLCFVGPPGTGKTTIAKAIAEVSNRPLIKIALGGLSDTAEFRG